MPLTQLDAVPALVVIDLQKGIVAAPTVHPSAAVVERAAHLLRAFRARGFPVVLVNVTGGAPGRTDAAPPRLARAEDWADLVPGLERQPSDLTVSKQRWDAFAGTGLDATLRGRAVSQVFLCGISTSIGVESSARHAHALGYHVVLVADAMTDLNADAHRNSVERIFPRLGEVDTTEAVLAALAG